MITHFLHTQPTDQAADPRPGNYYVSALDGEVFHLLLGPFAQHQSALDNVDAVRSFAIQHGPPKAAFLAYGTLRAADDVTRPGTANAHLPHLLAA